MTTQTAKTLATLECIDTLIIESLRESDVVYGDKELLELSEDLSVRIGIMWEKVYGKGA